MGKESAALPKRPRTACTACRTSPIGFPLFCFASAENMLLLSFVLCGFCRDGTEDTNLLWWLFLAYHGSCFRVKDIPL